MNIDKSKSNNIESDLSIGDKVRILDKRLLKKGSDPQYSSEIYTVMNVSGKTIYLSNGQIKKRNMLLKIHKDTNPFKYGEDPPYPFHQVIKLLLTK